MIIDIHTHLGRKPNVSASEDELLASMREASVDKAACFPLTGTVLEDNKRVRELACRSDSIIPFYRLNPHRVSPSDVKAALSQFSGVKLHPRGEDFDPLGDAFKAYLDVLREVDIPVLIHTRKENNPFSDPNRLLELPKRYADITFIFAHFANGLPSVIDALNEHDNLYLDTSIVSSPAIIEEAVRRANSEQILFGSDFPLSDQGLEKEKILRSSLRDDEKRRLLCENAKDMLSLK